MTQLQEASPTTAPDVILPNTRANRALRPEITSQELFTNTNLIARAYYADESTLIFNADARTALGWLAEAGLQVDCIVTSPPFYGQRDYGAEGQIGLEEHPKTFVQNLVDTFEAARPVLRDTGNLWVNLGDTYWSGKGQHRSDEKKQSARRFGLRPQDRTGDGKWCRPKQLLLIPHRFAIAMQDADWLVRNDNVWVKPNPIPDQVRDRCSISHEYVFHFAKERWYYFDRKAVGRKSEKGKILPPLDTWVVPPSRQNNGHKATFSEDLISIPIRATTPKNGIVLDPFAGSGTSLRLARKLGFRAIGIDISAAFCEMMTTEARQIAGQLLEAPPEAATETPDLEEMTQAVDQATHTTDVLENA
ncbi:DNA-methyltransferase [Deinococcus peraridilitoris]|uniref:Methyltransferase n=1 Tax=Deinococcus peraridilitoris (strain DSM 19664 / LMG 22246 / CIP 109416 / KR-200) TaxID=937777 RepID=L0A376_DEIPD|nr:site-specific DNA-methyltransferase [Deinococcus peraridilitoris]AFZ67899.1 DNA modification methylase [Deinococcus peraridilitoris DSM 19664]